MNRLYWKTVPLLGNVTSKSNSFGKHSLCLFTRGSLVSSQKICEHDLNRRSAHEKKCLVRRARLHSSTKNKDPIVTAKSSSDSLSSKSITEAWDVDFNNAEHAYKNKSTAELCRALLVFYLCNIKFLVTNGMQISHTMEKVLGKRLFNKIMKMSFYGHFVAGENQEEVNKTIGRLEEYGVGAILDYAVEEELSEEKAKDLEMDSCRPDMLDAEHSEAYMTRYQPHRQFGDRRQKVVSARTYFYEGEAKCDENMRIFLKCIESAGKATEGGFAAIKLTALGRPQFLLQFSEVLVKGRQLFEKFSGAQGTLVEKKFDLARFEHKAKRLGILMSRDTSRRWFTFMDGDESGYVDLLDWNELIARNRRFSDLFQILNPETGERERLLPNLSDEEEAQMKRMFQRVDVLAKRALQLNVRLMIDAEQTYFQHAISRITIEMMRKYNKEQSIIMNTYQGYLRETSNNLNVDIALADREKFHFGLKLVRGAYMEHERERAAQLDYDDPIQPSYEETNKNYNSMLSALLKRIREGEKVTVMAATHNEGSVKYALRKMHDYDFTSKQESQVYFGQLLGMCDYITFPLGHHGKHAFKYVPFGPISEVLPYLHRRAQENRSVLSAAKKERKMLRRELWRRLTSRRR